jgi:hypothetical protein
MNQAPSITPMATSEPVLINLQNGMPAITQSRSRELNYDTLEDNVRFVRNPYGPTWLSLSRSNYRWN